MDFKFPDLPKSKIYGDEQLTPEQLALRSYITEQTLSKEQEAHLEECRLFYKEVFAYLKSLDLTSFTEEDANKVWAYMKSVFNMHYIVQNDVMFKIIYRVSFVRENFLENGKVRHPKYLYNPPLAVNKDNGVFNRCNSPNTTTLYAAFNENVALRETKPQKGDRIILSVWENITGEPFVSYPIGHAFIENNEGVAKATASFNKKMQNHHPLFTEIMRMNLEFLASEMIKDKEVLSQKKYEYLYSAFFGEQCLGERNPKDPSPRADFIIYPSVAYKHYEDNICIDVLSLDKIRPIYLTEYEVLECHYEKPLTPVDPPVDLKMLRTAISISSERIGWSDD